jgi:predicted RNA polymerase sigma factor
MKGACRHRPIRGAGGVGTFRQAEGALHVLYLIFNEGYTVSSGPDLQRPDLATEAVRLTRAIHRSLPEDGEVAGLLALMLLTDARRAARTDAEGGLIPLAEQYRTRWDSDMIDEGTRLVTDAMLRSTLGPYQLQAAIASLHVQAPHAADTDWQQIRFLYQLLCRIAPTWAVSACIWPLVP